MSSRYAIVVIGYNRLHSVERLCDSLKCADYGNDKPDLIISLDFCEDRSIFEFAKKFSWSYGEKKVVFHEKRLGLRKHVLSCGFFLDEYEAIAVFEDDLYVSPAYYSYMKQAVEFYKDCDEIAGISFYGFERNWYTGLAFQPAYSECDTYFIQMAQSWGQIWLKKQWKEFYGWYLENENQDVFAALNIPVAIKKWGNASWLKYHTAYCVEKGKFFAYPYQSMTTCFMESGTHTKYSDITGQVRLVSEPKSKYKFGKLDMSAIRYDVFYERMGMEQYFESMIKSIRLCVDLYGSKYNFEGYTHILTTQIYKNLEPIKSYALSLKPHELNAIYSIQGKDIYLYNIQNKDMGALKVCDNKWKRIEYFSSPKIASDFEMLIMYLKKLFRKYFSRR